MTLHPPRTERSEFWSERRQGRNPEVYKRKKADEMISKAAKEGAADLATVVTGIVTLIFLGIILSTRVIVSLIYICAIILKLVAGVFRVAAAGLSIAVEICHLANVYVLEPIFIVINVAYPKADFLIPVAGLYYLWKFLRDRYKKKSY